MRSLLPTPFLVSLAAALGLGEVALEFGWVSFPREPGQVPRAWVPRLGYQKAYLAYGVILGAGIMTQAPFAATYAVAASTGFRPSVIAAAAIGAAFGLGRSLPVLAPIGRGTFLARGDELLVWAHRHLHPFGAAISVGITVLLTYSLLKRV